MSTPGPGRFNTRPRRSRYRGRRARSVALVIGAVFLCLLLGAGSVAAYRAAGFVGKVATLNTPIQLLQRQVDPPAGSIAGKLKHGQRVNTLALGYGGPENDAPWLPDSIMVVSIAPASR